MPSHSKPSPKLILLDVYETILDMHGIEKKVNSLLNSRKAYILWSELLMQYCFVDNCTIQFHEFDSIAQATLQMTAKMLKVSVDDEDIKAVLHMMKHLPVKEQVQQGLSALSDHGFRIAAMTNVPEKTVISRMEVTGLISYFEQVFSAEKVRKYKPSIEVYRWVAQDMDVSADETLVVSSHGWDIAGADNAGMQTAYITQPDRMLYALSSKPDLICKNLLDLAEQLRKT